MKNIKEIIPQEILERLEFTKVSTGPEVMDPPRIKRIAPLVNHKCDDCGLSVTPVKTMSYLQTPFWHWREKCVTCKRYKHPVTDLMVDFTGQELNRNLASQSYCDAYSAKITAKKSLRDK
tara:strand:- start:985 stop:1344 length:360 start_codon:yes stop_codon:yes gene_type:complete